MEKNLSKYVTVQQAADEIRLKPDLIQWIVDSKEIPYVFDGKNKLYNPDDVLKVISERFERFGISEKTFKKRYKDRMKPSEILESKKKEEPPVEEVTTE